MSLPIVLDAMGGDGAPLITIEAARLACQRGLGPISLVGDKTRIEMLLDTPLPEGVTVVNAPEVIGMSESPGRAARAKPQSSMHIGMKLIKEGNAAAFVTAGNSGAALAVGLVTLKRLEGCERPAIASLMPSKDQDVVLLDMGANVESRASHLAQFAVLGASYAKSILKRARPRIGLLSNGSEPSKGTEVLRETHRMLSQMDLNYIGYVEAGALPFGTCDVIITDGFVGNIVLKLSEGVVEALLQRLQQKLRSKWWSRFLGGLLRSSLKKLKSEVDWRTIGGAPILGLKGLVMITHGRADAEALCRSIQSARFYMESNLITVLSRAIESTPFSGSMSTTSEIPIIKGDHGADAERD